MPVRLLREGILTTNFVNKEKLRGGVINGETVSQRAYVPLALKKRLCAMPCAVCGVPFDIKADHVLPVSLGGCGTPQNLQPLCHDCNHIKHNRRTNEQVALIVAGRGSGHFRRAVYRHETRYFGAYDGPSQKWERENADRINRLAMHLYIAFLGRNA